VANKRKAYSASQGIVDSADLGTVYTREIFFQVDPADLAHLDDKEVRDKFPRGSFVEFDPMPLMEYLPPLEAEIFWLLYDRGKNQKDVAALLQVSQPKVSYRYRRTIDKLAYLMVLVSLDLRSLIEEMDFLKPIEKLMLFDLFYCAHQEMVGRKYGKRQSSVKWVFVRAKDRLEAMERQDPEKWSKHLALMFYLEENLEIRVMN